jgi:hypothetical protein
MFQLKKFDGTIVAFLNMQLRLGALGIHELNNGNKNVENTFIPTS